MNWLMWLGIGVVVLWLLAVYAARNFEPERSRHTLPFYEKAMAKTRSDKASIDEKWDENHGNTW